MNAVTQYTAPQAPQEPQVYRPPTALDPARIEFLWGLANKIAGSSMVPESLRTEGTKGNKRNLPPEQVVANVFFVVEQADRWNFSPWALIPCAAIVHGKLGFEGKVISAVLEANFGIQLTYEWSGEGENMTIVVGAADASTGEVLVSAKTKEPLTINGTVKEWKTTGDNSPWAPKNFQKMLAYRGAREWARLHKPAAMMGVLSLDELIEVEAERRALEAFDVTPSAVSRLRSANGGAGGFNADAVDTATKQIEGAGSVPMDMANGPEREKVETRTTATAPVGAPATANVEQQPAADEKRLADLAEALDAELTKAKDVASIETRVDAFKADNPDLTPAEMKALKPVKARHLARVKQEAEAAQANVPGPDDDGALPDDEGEE